MTTKIVCSGKSEDMVRTSLERLHSRRPKILVVEDSDDDRTLLTKAIRTAGAEPVECADPECAFAALSDPGKMPSIVFLDLKLESGRTGIEVLEFVRKHNIPVPVVVISGEPACWPSLRGLPFLILTQKPVDADVVAKLLKTFKCA